MAVVIRVRSWHSVDDTVPLFEEDIAFAYLVCSPLGADFQEDDVLVVVHPKVESADKGLKKQNDY